VPKKGGGIAAYNAIISAIKSRTGVSHKEAQQTYRASSVRLGRAPTLRDAQRSPAITAESRRAGIAIARAKAERQLKVERAIAKAKAPRRKDKTPVKVEPPKRRGAEPGGADRGGGGGGAGGGRAPAPVEDVPDWVELDPPDEFGGDDGDYVPD